MYYPLCFDQGVGQCAVSVSTKITAPSLLSYMSATTCTTTHNSTQGEVALSSGAYNSTRPPATAHVLYNKPRTRPRREREGEKWIYLLTLQSVGSWDQDEGHHNGGQPGPEDTAHTTALVRPSAGDKREEVTHFGPLLLFNNVKLFLECKCLNNAPIYMNLLCAILCQTLLLLSVEGSEVR